MRTIKQKVIAGLLLFVFSFIIGFAVAETRADAAEKSLYTERFKAVEYCGNMTVLLDQYEGIYYLLVRDGGGIGSNSTITVMYDASGEILTSGRYDIPIKEEKPEPMKKPTNVREGWYY